MFPNERGHRPDRLFVVLEQHDGTEMLALEGPHPLARELGDLTAFQAWRARRSASGTWQEQGPLRQATGNARAASRGKVTTKRLP